MTKNWEDTAENIANRKKQELLSRRQVEEAQRVKLMKELAAENAANRAQVLKEARELILQRKPQCRLINRALLVSEGYRVLETQKEAKREKENAERKLDEEWARHVIEDVEKYRLEEEEKREKRMRELKKHNEALDRQVEENRRSLKKLEESIRKAELEDIRNMSNEINEIKERELKLAREKREALIKMFDEAIEERKKYEKRVKEEEEFEMKVVKIFNEMKTEMQRSLKEKIKAAKDERMRQIEVLAKRLEKIKKEKEEREASSEQHRDAIVKKLEEQKKLEDLEKIKLAKEKKEKARRDMQEQLKWLEEEQERKRKEEMELQLWEALQRYKRDEFNKEWNQQKRLEEKSKRLTYGKILKKQMIEQEREKKKLAKEEDDSKAVKDMIDTANARVLAYGEKIMKESQGVRPTYPIVKAIEEFKRDVGLTRHKRDEEAADRTSVPKRDRGKRVVRPKVVEDQDAFQLG
ncbi:trichohyalin-like [Trichogramma pretiosum]|uniref:trichohyalin-like n=1 Tax=Trichogramma pretiosum TaxID=7493 RepID=UPI000C71A634|nr:trichohyalin-like [Trichogramma pretiosum]